MAGDDVDLTLRLTGEDAGASDLLTRTGTEIEKTGGKLKALGAVAAGAGAVAGGLLASGFAAGMELSDANAKLTAQLGLSKEMSATAGAAAGEVYARGWGDSIADVNTAIKAVGSNISDLATLSRGDIESMSQSALVLARTFDVDVNTSTQAAGQLMKNGLAKDATEAFDIVAAGLRDGGADGEDFLATLNEYSPQFAKLGISGTQALAMLQAGLKAGAKDTDVIADVFKEFTLLAINGSKTTSAAYKAIGMDAKQASADIAAGGDRANEATRKVLSAIQAIKDPLKQNEVGIALFGTQWEDTLRTILPAMADVSNSSTTVAGSMDAMTQQMGGTNKQKIDSLRRSFEEWTAGLSSGNSTVGLAATGVLEYGNSALSIVGSLGMASIALQGFSVASAASRVATIAGSVATGVATAAQWLWNAALTANPIGLIVVAIAALVAGIVYFFTQTETGRAIFSATMAGINTAWNTTRELFTAGFNWFRSNWQLLLGILTGPFGAAAMAIVKHKDTILTAVKAIPDQVKNFFSGAGTWLSSAGQSIINGLVNGIKTAANSALKSTLTWVTSMIPSWKGPPERDADLLRPAGALMMGGLADEVMRQTPALQASLGSVTDTIGGTRLGGAGGFGGGQSIVVNVSAGSVGDEDHLVRTITDALGKAGARGYLPASTGSVFV